MSIKKLSILTCACLSATYVSAQQITIPTVTIGNAGNAADPTTGYGSVANAYNIGSTEVTNAQYVAFLNAVADTDTHGLYNASMAGEFGGIMQSGEPGSYTYATISGRANNPVNFVSFWDATRFANWLHNGQGNGDTETGAYTLTSDGIGINFIPRNSGWRWAVTSEDEWYKAAFHQPASQGGDVDNYWFFTTSSNDVPTTEQANYSASGIGNTMPVGSYAANFYATFDMGGNVAEWTEARIAVSNRGLRGGAYTTTSAALGKGFRGSRLPSTGASNVGFRVSQAVPEPSSMIVLGAGALAILRRRKKA